MKSLVEHELDRVLVKRCAMLVDTERVYKKTLGI